MRFAFSDEQEALRQSVRRFLETHGASARVRQAMATETGFDADLWSRVAEELGWTALTVPETYGGVGYGPVELVAVMEEMGRTLFPSPFFSHVCLATPAVLEAGTEAQTADLLPALAGGELRAALAHAEPGERLRPEDIEATLTRDGEEVVLTGTKAHVVDGHTADRLVVAARTPGSAGLEGLSLVVVDPTAEGVQRELTPTLDLTRKLATVTFDQVRLPASAILGEEGAAGPALARVLDVAAIALAAEQVGGADQCLVMSVDYAQTRVQFGRPIGTFQAIKHKCADMLVQVESARSACYYAAWVAATGAADLATAASQARAVCSEAYFAVAAETIQIHGGIGFTWEHDAHLHFKRARASQALLGDPNTHRERYLTTVLSHGDAANG